MPFYAFAVICRIFRDAKSRAPPILSTRLYLYRDKDTTLHCLFTKKVIYFTVTVTVPLFFLSLSVTVIVVVPAFNPFTVILSSLTMAEATAASLDSAA